MKKATIVINIWADDGQELPADDLPETFEPCAARVREMVAQGYVSGELSGDNFRGWWDIREGVNL